MLTRIRDALYLKREGRRQWDTHRALRALLKLTDDESCAGRAVRPRYAEQILQSCDAKSA